MTQPKVVVLWQYVDSPQEADHVSAQMQAQCPAAQCVVLESNVSMHFDVETLMEDQL